MLTDAHCHPYDLIQIFSNAEDERKKLNVLAAASACTLDEFLYNETLPDVLPYFGIHPQYYTQISSRRDVTFPWNVEAQGLIRENLEILNNLAEEKRITAIGECGFDLYEEYKETEAIQEEVFAAQLEIALKHDLPLVLHVRRAIFKIFALTKKLAKCKAVIFHSWPGTLEEANSLLRRGINAYFSFGNVLMLNHKKAIQCCAFLPAERLLTETDAPYAPRRTDKISSWADLPLILETAAALRTQTGNSINAKNLELQIELNFKNIFKKEPLAETLRTQS
ncbi:MAG: TatD family hydrolase [Treponema sp.]|nr:TatD family hydrolase [Treponema sp.]